MKLRKTHQVYRRRNVGGQRELYIEINTKVDAVAVPDRNHDI
jgi:hypothetical protein